jgi:site-specific recombinase XerC
MTASIPTFSTLLQRFFTQRLMQQKQVSPHTISSYRDAFKAAAALRQKAAGHTP